MVMYNKIPAFTFYMKKKYNVLCFKSQEDKAKGKFH